MDYQKFSLIESIISYFNGFAPFFVDLDDGTLICDHGNGFTERFIVCFNYENVQTKDHLLTEIIADGLNDVVRA